MDTITPTLRRARRPKASGQTAIAAPVPVEALERVRQVLAVAKIWDGQAPKAGGAGDLAAPARGWHALFGEAEARGFLPRPELALKD